MQRSPRCFREQEDAAGYFALLRTVLERYGVPLALCSDRHGIFFRSPRERESIQEELLGWWVNVSGDALRPCPN